MSVTATQLRDFVAVSATEVSDTALEGYVATATALVDEYLRDVPVTVPPEEPTVPVAIRDRAELLVAAEMFTQDQAPNGFLNQQFDTTDGLVTQPVRISSDPLRPAYPLLSSWVPPVIA